MKTTPAAQARSTREYWSGSGSKATTAFETSDLRTPSVSSNENGWLLAPGVVLQGTYRVAQLIATGGMGDVYRATHERLQGDFAIKVLHRDLMREEELLSRFRTEAKIMASLHHPNIVQVFDFNVMPDGTPYLAMELAEGKDLRNIIIEQRRLSPIRVAQIVTQTASALGAAHAHGVVHRDLKPENVMLVEMEDRSVCVKVVDFGVSKTRGPVTITEEQTVVGTPEFMSPEQAQGRNNEIDHRTDQFALGSLAYTLLTGREPFRGSTAVAVMYQVVHEEALPVRDLLDWPCPRVNEVLRRAMAKDRHHRFPSILEFARAFEEAVGDDLSLDSPQGRRRTPMPEDALPDLPKPRERALVREDEVNGDDESLDPTPAEVPRPSKVWSRRLLLVASATGLLVATIALGAAHQGGWPTNSASAGLAGAYDALSESASRLISRVRTTVLAPDTLAR